MSSLKKSVLLLSLLLWCALAGADHLPDAHWSWHLVSAGADESRLSVYRGNTPLGIYDISCDLTDAREGESVEDSAKDRASLNLVRPVSNPQGLLVINCNVGAHSQLITIIDLTRKSKQPVFTATGSYSATWEIQGDELWIAYDEPCDTGPGVECPDGFETVFVQYPGAATE
jgi:hypothetical protein